ncbi:MAG TPA: DUF4876 domain-containing protein [Bacteroidales bacterium]|nr:DUF4876 domain-containing protein [Bacteroidales bacterium]HRT32929.1 DUF4876 domain-containing protein [Bacteroidales bacterium]HRT83033.1 DUF4876 domain-containing protein [Bacteroidales bacterium]
MKNKIKIFMVFLWAFAGLTACDQFDDNAHTKKVEPVRSVIVLDLQLGDAPTPSEFNVKLINYNERYEINKTMSSDGMLTVDDVIPGIYTITVSAEMNEHGFTYNYSGSVVNTEIIRSGVRQVVKVESSKAGNLVLKEVFYCGSKTPSGGSYFRDQFYEIYNNSETVQNVKGLCIAIINPLTATANLPVWAGEDADKYVYALQIWQVPTDQDYPLNPGESIIIAQMADNHQKPTLNPNSPVNLITAEFETLVRTSSIISDNPAINMTMAFWPSPTPQWLTTVFGGAFVIYFPSQPIVPANYVTPVGSTTKCYKIPISEVVDALELVGNVNQMNLKRMPTVLDAGAATVGGTYNGKSVARKVKETVNGRVILYDTNNSTNDFEVMDTPMIRRYGAKAPSWNTWD